MTPARECEIAHAHLVPAMSIPGSQGALPLDEHPQPEPGPEAPGPATSPRQRAALIHRLRTLMEFWGITADELRRHTARPTPRPPASPKYRHPATGDTWDGQGSQPAWLRLALLKEGFTVEQLRQAALATTESPTQVEGEAPGADGLCP
jgi:DNA-binding protein H-NS